MLPKKVFLVGFMGSGKSTVGKVLAKKLRVPFVDLDEEIQIREGLTIDKIFSLKGERYFRELEVEVLKDITYSLPAFVMATGGGLGANEEAMEFMKRHGTVVWLRIPFETFKKRTGRDPNRPLLKRGEEELKRLFEERQRVYSKAHIHIDSQRSVEETVELILRRLKELNSPGG